MFGSIWLKCESICIHTPWLYLDFNCPEMGEKANHFGRTDELSKKHSMISIVLIQSEKGKNFTFFIIIQYFCCKHKICPKHDINGYPSFTKLRFATNSLVSRHVVLLNFDAELQRLYASYFLSKSTFFVAFIKPNDYHSGKLIRLKILPKQDLKGNIVCQCL